MQSIPLHCMYVTLQPSHSSQMLNLDLNSTINGEQLQMLDMFIHYHKLTLPQLATSAVETIDTG